MIRENPTHHALAGSYFADVAAARQAIALVRPMIATALADPTICGAGSCCAIVMDPAMTPQACATFHDAVLIEDDFDTRSHWDADYATFARAKARTAWLHEEDGLDLVTRRPQCLREGDSLLRGAVRLDGIVVAVSGCSPWYDEAIACAIAASLRAIAIARFEAARSRGALAAGT
jgi:hypothetical protein